jgi:hypothetical protein
MGFTVSVYMSKRPILQNTFKRVKAFFIYTSFQLHTPTPPALPPSKPAPLLLQPPICTPLRRRDRITPRHPPLHKPHRIIPSPPRTHPIHRKIRTHNLRPTRKRQIPHLRRPILHRAHRNIRSRTNYISLGNQIANDGRPIATRLVVLDDRCVGRASKTIRKHGSVLQGGCGGAVEFSWRRGVGGVSVVVEEEEEAAAEGVEGWPAVGEDRLFEGQVSLSNVVGADEAVFGEHGEDFGVDVEEAGERPVGGFAGAHAAELAGGGVGFELEVDEDGDVVFVFVGPGFEGAEAVDEGVADGVGVEVGYMEDFDTGLFEHFTIEGSCGVGEVGELPCGGWVV